MVSTGETFVTGLPSFLCCSVLRVLTSHWMQGWWQSPPEYHHLLCQHQEAVDQTRLEGGGQGTVM